MAHLPVLGFGGMTVAHGINFKMITLELTINNIIMADIQLQVGAGNKNANFTLYDTVTSQVIGGVTWTNQQIVSNSNPTAGSFTIPTGNPNMVIGQPLAAGSGVVASATASYTDPGDGQTKTGSFSVTKNFTVLGAAHGATMDLPFA